MKVKRKANQREEVLLGIRPDKYLVYADVSGSLNWESKDYFEALGKEPAYLVEDEIMQGQKVVEIFKRKYDLDFPIGKLEWNESLTPLYFKRKRTKLALESIGMGDLFPATGGVYSDDFYFSMLVGKFETINEIIDSSLREEEAHSRFDWYKTFEEEIANQELTDAALEKGIIELCRLVSAKIIKGKYSGYLFTDIYAIWRTFLLGAEFLKYGELKILDNLEPKFIGVFKKGSVCYHFQYQFFVC